MALINIEELKELCRTALTNAGMTAGDAETALDHYVENELSGKSSHGIVRVVEAARALEKYGAAAGEPEMVTDTGNMVVLDARRQIAVVAGRALMDMGIERAREHGLVFAGVRNYIASMGSMAYFLRRIADQGLIAIMGCNSVAQVAPPGGCERVIGTNPFGIAIPGDHEEGLIADFGTAAIAYGKIMVMKDRGESVPEGLLVDEHGELSTDPADAYNGAILPLAGHKGFALGLMIELMAGALLGGKSSKKELYDQDGFFMILLDPKKSGQNDFTKSVSTTLKNIRKSNKMEGYSEISLPGSRSLKTFQENLKRGRVEVADKTLEKLQKLAKKGAS